MTKALLTAGALVALTLAMQEAAGQPAEDPLAGLKTVKLKERPSPKRPGDKLAAPIPANPSQAAPADGLDEAEAIRPGIGPLGALIAGGGTYTTSGPSGRPPSPPPPQATPAPQQPPASAAPRPSSPWSGLFWGFK